MARRSLLPVLAAMGALVVAGWFYIGTRQTSDLAAAGKIVNDGDRLSAAESRHARALLHAAAVLNPDRTVDLYRSRAALETGNRALAYRLATAVTRAEPMNATAWGYVYRAAPDGAARKAAVAHVIRLYPGSVH